MIDENEVEAAIEEIGQQETIYQTMTIVAVDRGTVTTTATIMVAVVVGIEVVLREDRNPTPWKWDPILHHLERVRRRRHHLIMVLMVEDLKAWALMVRHSYLTTDDEWMYDDRHEIVHEFQRTDHGVIVLVIWRRNVWGKVVHRLLSEATTGDALAGATDGI